MRTFFTLLAFCSCGYILLGCIGEAMSYAPPSGWTPLRFFLICVSVCCVWAIFRITTAVIAVWIATLIYLVVSYRLYAPWLFRDCIERFVPWAPLFLTIAAFADYRDRRAAL